MAQEDKRITGTDLPEDDEATQLKKRARRRLIGAVALALFVAVVLPMVMEHQPAPPLKDIQVRIPSPDEGGLAKTPTGERVATGEVKPIGKSETKAESKSAHKPEAKEGGAGEAASAAEAKPAPKPAPAPPAKPETKPETKPESKTEAKSETKPSVSGETWEVQLGAYAEPARVRNLVAKLKELGLPSYTEKIETPNGPRTRVRAGPFPTQEAAEKARARLKAIGVDGPVARKG